MNKTKSNKFVNEREIVFSPTTYIGLQFIAYMVSTTATWVGYVSHFLCLFLFFLDRPMREVTFVKKTRLLLLIFAAMMFFVIPEILRVNLGIEQDDKDYKFASLMLAFGCNYALMKYIFSERNLVELGWTIKPHIENKD